MKYPLTFFAVFFLTSLACAGEQPNVVLIMADDFGYECVTANGGRSYETPNLDRLAETGMRFERCFVQPLCTPTRVQLMTGMYNVRNYTKFGELHRSQKTFGNFFREAGYVTGIFGKWQLGGDKDMPDHFGFDEYCLWQHTREIVFKKDGGRIDLRRPRYANPGLEFQGDEKDFRSGEYGPEIICEKALDFIDRHKEKPFLLYYPMILTHPPFQPTPDSPDWDPKRSDEKYGRPKHFKEMVKYMDAIVGRIVQKLEETDLHGKTLVVFLGDNGTAQNIVSDFNGKEYRGGKGTTTDAGMHVPLIVHWPGRIEPASIDSDLVDSTDFLPTLCEATGIQLPENSEMDGISFFPRLAGRESRFRDWIYCWYLGQRQEGKQSVFARDKRFKLYEDGTVIDLQEDPLEKQPMTTGSLEGPAKISVKRLQSVLARYRDARPQWISRRHAEQP